MKDDKKIQFTWKIGEDKLIDEEFNLQNFKNELIDKGSIAEEISLACMAIQKNRNSKLFQFEPIKLLDDIRDGKEITPFESSLKKFIKDYSDNKFRLKKDVDKSCFNYHILECIALKFVESECEKALNNDNNNVICINEDNSSIMRKYNEIFTLSISNQNNNKDFGLIKLKELIREINENKQLSKAYVNFSAKKRKCIALYSNKQTEKITIAFSGYKDYECQKIKNFIEDSNNSDRNNKNPTLKNYYEIANAIGASLANLNCTVSRYDINYKNQIIRYYSLNELMRKKINKDNGLYHSCCERKIFAYLEDCNETVESGKLFVKYAPCRDCWAAILYHILNKGQEFSMEVGLPNL